MKKLIAASALALTLMAGAAFAQAQVDGTIGGQVQVPGANTGADVGVTGSISGDGGVGDLLGDDSKVFFDTNNAMRSDEDLRVGFNGLSDARRDEIRGKCSDLDPSDTNLGAAVELCAKLKTM